LYTLVVKDAQKAEKLRQSLPPGKHGQSDEDNMASNRILTDLHCAALVVKDI
jgi:hypothetical protein